MFVHHVYFWLKAGSPVEAGENLVRDCRAILGRIPGVEQLWAGTPAGTSREVVDNSYAVGLEVIFKDSGAHDVYQKHELHLEFIERNKGVWKRVRVFDFCGLE